LIERIVHGGVYWGWKAAATIAQRLPARPLYAFAVAMGEVGYVAWTAKRKIAKHNFSIVLGRPSTDREVARVARRSFRNFAKYIVEIMRFPLLGIADFERLVTIDGWENLRGALALGKGVIFVSIHFGNFELGGARISDEIPLNVIADELENQRLMDLLVGNRAHKNITLLTPDGAAKKVLQALRRNEMVGLMMDLGPRAQAFETVDAEFFGTLTAFPAVAASLARVSGAPIVVSACVRHRDNTFTGFAQTPIHVERTKQAAEDVQRATQAIARGLETFVRRWPDQWYIFRPMWPQPVATPAT